jgi:hypothetical protein
MARCAARYFPRGTPRPASPRLNGASIKGRSGSRTAIRLSSRLTRFDWAPDDRVISLPRAEVSAGGIFLSVMARCAALYFPRGTPRPASPRLNGPSIKGRSGSRTAIRLSSRLTRFEWAPDDRVISLPRAEASAGGIFLSVMARCAALYFPRGTPLPARHRPSMARVAADDNGSLVGENAGAARTVPC